MIIDIHTHITYEHFPEFAKVFLGRGPFTADVLLRRMDMEGIDPATDTHDIAIAAAILHDCCKKK